MSGYTDPSKYNQQYSQPAPAPGQYYSPPIPQQEHHQQYGQYPLQPDHQQLHYQSPQPIVSPSPAAPNPSFSQQPTPQPPPDMAKGHAGAAHAGGPQAWQYDMCGCFGDMGKCCMTCWCPCITYSKIQHRLRHNDMTGYSNCNGPCWGFCALGMCGLQWVMSMMQRGEVRHKYNLVGSGCGDCMRHCCCECCTLIQEDRETETRNSQLVVPAISTGYNSQPAMKYPQ
ncbi:hypothetical protein Dda_1144 [Drechslerella dactyloides]|uniref:PLAC8-domain-containing protein n=1 Tax=Drechslerella dactyloides TaxID=74499 RepID=A0AAD6J5S5_DREDA|nr:hypothetical protein Dda_1144 [Drechslerella dactyloides]